MKQKHFFKIQFLIRIHFENMTLINVFFRNSDLSTFLAEKNQVFFSKTWLESKCDFIYIFVQVKIFVKNWCRKEKLQNCIFQKP